MRRQFSEMCRTRKHQGGFASLAILIGIIAVSLVMTTMMPSAKMRGRMINIERYNEDIKSYTNESRLVLSDPNICKVLFNGASAANVVSGANLKTQEFANLPYQNSMLQTMSGFLKLDVQNVTMTPAPTQPSPGQGYLANLNFEIHPKGDFGYVQNVQIPVYYTTATPGGAISSCQSTVYVGKNETLQQHLCGINGGTYDPASQSCNTKSLSYISVMAALKNGDSGPANVSSN